ncbi:trypsin-4 [Procambarus clarkii]|uniref:trypsin-4 n=1 Tax=Procambarus clarkii TaxID=6728 RepID=UPI00374488AB
MCKFIGRRERKVSVGEWQLKDGESEREGESQTQVAWEFHNSSEYHKMWTCLSCCLLLLHALSLEASELRQGPREPPHLRQGPREPPQLRQGPREPPHLKQGPREPPHLRQGPREPPQLRQGPREPPQLRQGPREPPYLKQGPREPPHLKQGPREPPHLKQGPREPPQLRQGPREPPHLKQGPREPPHLKQGPREPPQLRQGPREPPHLKQGPREPPHLKQGPREPPHLKQGPREPPHLKQGPREPPQRQVHIIGGDDAAPGEFPHQVSVQTESFLGPVHVCGGTIISNDYILTTAHCVSRFEPNTVRIVAGIIDLKDPGGQVSHAKTFIPHESYNPITNANDILLIKLEEKLVFGELVKPLGLPPSGETVPEDTVCTVIGWGATIHNGNSNNKLQKVDVAVVSDETCRLSYGQEAVEPSMMCAGWSDGHADACQGDRGGPLLCWGRLHGLSSWGEDCGNPFYPGVYTEVAYFRDWIIIHASAMDH